MKPIKSHYFKLSEVQKKRRLHFFRIKNDARVLDVGCSDGVNSAFLFEKGIRSIVGIDKSSRYIRKAKKLHPHLTFHVGVAEKLPFSNASFDAVFVDSVFHHLEDYEKALVEIKRVLVPSGLLCFIEPHASVKRKILDWFTKMPIHFIFPLLRERNKEYVKEKEEMKRWLQEEHYFFTLLKKQGFTKCLLRKDLLSIIAQYEKG